MENQMIPLNKNEILALNMDSLTTNIKVFQLKNNKIELMTSQRKIFESQRRYEERFNRLIIRTK